MMAVVVPTTLVSEARSYRVSPGETCGLDDFQSVRPNPFSQPTAPLRPTTTAAPGKPPARIPRCTTRSMTRRRAADMPTEAGALTGSPPSPPAMARAASNARTTADLSSKTTVRAPIRGDAAHAATRAWGNTPGLRQSDGLQLSQEREQQQARTVVRTGTGGLQSGGTTTRLEVGRAILLQYVGLHPVGKTKYMPVRHCGRRRRAQA